MAAQRNFACGVGNGKWSPTRLPLAIDANERALQPSCSISEESAQLDLFKLKAKEKDHHYSKAKADREHGSQTLGTSRGG